ncbi:hypothetical protein F4803DRAFT_545893 [Xylaria telfairii]|nr:hypothetical protein F4803DRAFT_545893 [Xylaria telfairii]
MSSNNRDKSNKNERRLKPATTFDEILERLKIFPSKPKKSSIAKRASTITRQVIIGPTVDELTGRNDKAIAAKEAKAKQKQAAEEQAANTRGERLQRLRSVVLTQGKSPRESDLYDLASHEGVYLGPRQSQISRLTNGELLRVELAAWVVARVSGPMDDGKYKGKYLFLGRNKSMYVGSNPLGADSVQVSVEDEYEHGYYREIARAYYGLCN